MKLGITSCVNNDAQMCFSYDINGEIVAKETWTRERSLFIAACVIGARLVDGSLQDKLLSEFTREQGATGTTEEQGDRTLCVFMVDQ